MEEHVHAQHDVIDEWWPLGLIVFGVSCVSFLIFFTASW